MENKKMFPIIDFSDWEELHLPASGVRKKMWLRNSRTGEMGLFKYPKTDYTGDYWAEKLAYEIGKLINIDVAKTELGLYNGLIGSFSYSILGESEYLLEGYSIIGDVLDFSTSSDIYDNIGLDYSVQLLEDVLGERFCEFLKVIIFDCLIGNTDRHHGNWAFVTNDNGDWLRVSPLYDNGSSLCYLERVERIDLMRKDKVMLESALFTKPKSQIGLGNIRPANHFDLFSYLCFKYAGAVKKIMLAIENGITNESLTELFERLDNNIVDVKLKHFVNIFLLERKNKMCDILNGGF